MHINEALVSCQYFYRNSACRHRHNRYETYQTDFSFRSCLNPWVDLLGGTEANIQRSQNMVMFHFKIKEMTHAETW